MQNSVGGGRAVSDVFTPSAAVGLLLLLTALGCRGPLALSPNDAIVLPGAATVTLAAYLKEDDRLGMREGVRGVDLRFFVGETLVGQERTGPDGRARVTIAAEGPLEREFRVEADAFGRHLSRMGRIYTPDPGRVGVAVDIDETLSQTEIDSLLFRRSDRESDPLDHSVKALTRLATDFEIVYLTARPRFLIEKTRDWLARHGYPSGPLLTSPHWRRSLRGGGRFKTETLTALRAEWPNVLIGIGDRETDLAAYRAAGMLPIIVLDESRDEDRLEDGAPGAVVMENWKDVLRYFERHRERLIDPDRVREWIGRIERGAFTRRSGQRLRDRPRRRPNPSGPFGSLRASGRRV